MQETAGGEIEHLPADVHPGDFQVMRPLAVGQAGLQLPGLGVDEIGRERPGVAPEQRVRQRAVPPEEAAQMEPDQQHGQGIQQPGKGVRTQGGGKHRPVGQGEGQVAGHQHGLKLDAVLVMAPGDDATGLNRGDAQTFEIAQHAVFANGQGLTDLLEGVDPRAQPHEPHDVPGDTPGERDELVLRPGLERNLPGQLEQRRVVGRSKNPHRYPPPRSRTRGRTAPRWEVRPRVRSLGGEALAGGG